jgi:hypothetical protein
VISEKWQAQEATHFSLSTLLNEENLQSGRARIDGSAAAGLGGVGA